MFNMILNLFFSKIGLGLGFWARSSFKMFGFWVEHSGFGLGRQSLGWATQPNADPWSTNVGYNVVYKIGSLRL